MPSFVLTLVTTPSYISLINLIYFRGNLFFSKTYHNLSRYSIIRSFYINKTVGAN